MCVRTLLHHSAFQTIKPIQKTTNKPNWCFPYPSQCSRSHAHCPSAPATFQSTCSLSKPPLATKPSHFLPAPMPLPSVLPPESLLTQFSSHPSAPSPPSHLLALALSAPHVPWC